MNFILKEDKNTIDIWFTVNLLEFLKSYTISIREYRLHLPVIDRHHHPVEVVSQRNEILLKIRMIYKYFSIFLTGINKFINNLLAYWITSLNQNQ